MQSLWFWIIEQRRLDTLRARAGRRSAHGLLLCYLPPLPLRWSQTLAPCLLGARSFRADTRPSRWNKLVQFRIGCDLLELLVLIGIGIKTGLI